jgi:hypothetical protein
MTYIEWNERIARRFFNEQNAGKKVFLCVEDALLEQLGGPTGKADFIAAVKSGPETARRPGLSVCTQARRTWEEWRNRSQEFPAYLAYLGLFVLAASQEGERETGYYKRLHRLLGEESTNRPPPCFYEMWPLWDDLEDWANDEQNGKLGIVSCDFAGAWPHVGLPRAQIVLTERERAKLTELFAAAELDSSAPPASEEMAHLARRHGHGRLEARTMRRLAREGEVDEEMRSLTIEALLDELRSWDGVVENDEGSSAGFHALRLNLRIKDRISGIADSRFVVRDSPNFPDVDMRVTVVGDAGGYQIGGLNATWLILRGADGTNMDATDVSWTQGLRLCFEEIVFRLPPRRVRVLRNGEFDHVEGLIEVNRLDPHREFYVVVTGESVGAIETWGKRAGKNWKEIVLRSGLPSGVRLFRADSADPAIVAPAEFPVLRTDSLVRVLLQDGIKTEPMGRRYFEFAPPKVCVEGLTPDNIVKVNRRTYPTVAGDVTITVLPSETEPSNRVSVLLGQEEKRFTSFQIVSERDIPWKRAWTWASGSDGTQVDSSESTPRVLGAAVFGYEAPPVIIGTERTADIIGSKPGQVATLPGDPLPTEWTPVWLIEHGRSNRRVIFCGADLEHCDPQSEPASDGGKVRDWQRLLWNERRQLAGPTRGPLVALWRKFREAARNG